MSRLERLKELRRKNIIKATACGLALALAIGSAQGLGTYALFTDTEDVASNLTISTGDVDVKVSKGQTVTSIGEEIAFEITNEGTLNQNISLNIIADQELRNNLGDVGIYFYSDTDSNPNISEIKKEVLDKYIDLTNNNKELFVLSPGQTIQGSIDLDIKSSIIENKEYKLNLQVNARQINKSKELKNYGFYDEDIQKNTININSKESVILEDYNGGLSFKKNESIYKYINVNYYGRSRAKGLISAIDLLDGTSLDATRGNIESVNCSGVFSDDKCEVVNNQSGKKIQINNISTDSQNTIKYYYGAGNHINIKFKYANDSIAFYRVDFRRDKTLFIFDSIEAKVTKISQKEFEDDNLINISTLQDIEEVDESDTVESFKEDIQEIELDIIEQPKEDIEEESVEQEVVDIPKDDIVEQPNEEVEEPSEPEIVEPPNFEEVVLPSKTDVILERKEEIEIEE